MERVLKGEVVIPESVLRERMAKRYKGKPAHEKYLWVSRPVPIASRPETIELFSEWFEVHDCSRGASADVWIVPTVDKGEGTFCLHYGALTRASVGNYLGGLRKYQKVPKIQDVFLDPSDEETFYSYDVARRQRMGPEVMAISAEDIRRRLHNFYSKRRTLLEWVTPFEFGIEIDDESEDQEPIHVDWRLVPKGRISQLVQRAYAQAKTPEERKLAQCRSERLLLLQSLNPIQWWRAEAALGHRSYLVAEFPFTVAAEGDYCNALYVYPTDVNRESWRDVLLRSRKEIRAAGGIPVYHAGDWERRARLLVTGHVRMQGLF